MTKGDLQQAAAVSQRHKMLWKDEILPQYEAEEKRFLISHADHIIVPFILAVPGN